MQAFYCEIPISSSNFHLLHMHTQSVNLADKKKKNCHPFLALRRMSSRFQLFSYLRFLELLFE